VAVSSEIIKTLMTREWVRQVGQRDVPGRPALYGTTRGFLEHFNLKSLAELPPLAELRDIEQIAAELNMSLPVGDDASAPKVASAGVAPGDESDIDDDADDAGEDDAAGEHRAAAGETEAQAVQADPGNAPAKL